MDEYLKHQILVSERHNTPLSLIIADFDLFSSVNDTFGHVVGDVILKNTTDAIVNCTRDGDVVFGYGGEEFVVILINPQGVGADFLAERIWQAVAALEIEALAHTMRITVSAAGLQFFPGDIATMLLARADEQLYKRKILERNRTETA